MPPYAEFQVSLDVRQQLMTVTKIVSRILLLTNCAMPLVTFHPSPAAADEAVSLARPCEYDRAEMLALDQNAFDQGPAGWRSITQQGDCNLEAADLVHDYVAEHNLKVSILYWHEGQLRAMAGQTDRAIPLLNLSRKPETTTDRFGWNHYVDATIAFLKKDRSSLVDARAVLSVTPKPPNFNPVDVNGNPVEVIWPPNLNVVDGLLDCFDQSYDRAYNNCSQPFSRQQADEN